MTATYAAPTVNENINEVVGFEARDSEDGPYTAQVVYGYSVTAGNEAYEWSFEADTKAEVEAELARVAGKPELIEADWARRTPYGSPAWGSEDEYELACFEADSYGEGRPGYCY